MTQTLEEVKENKRVWAENKKKVHFKTQIRTISEDIRKIIVVKENSPQITLNNIYSYLNDLEKKYKL